MRSFKNIKMKLILLKKLINLVCILILRDFILVHIHLPLQFFSNAKQKFAKFALFLMHNFIDFLYAG